MATNVKRKDPQIPQVTSIRKTDSSSQSEGSAFQPGEHQEGDLGSRPDEESLQEKNTAQATTKRQPGRWKPLVILSNGVAILALVFSYLGISAQQKSIEEGRKLAYDNATQQIIHDQYELCRVLDQLRVEHPELSHMLALPASDPADPWKNYRVFKEKVGVVLSEGKNTITAADRDKLILQEHAVALHVFDIYEQTVYQWQAAAAVKDNQRAEILKMLVEYYEGRMLRNPRLRYHWNHGGADMLEENPTRQRYNQFVGINSHRYPNDFVDNDSPLDSLVSPSP
jgi:hypothetical protein